MPKKRTVPKAHSVRAAVSIPELAKAGSSLNLELYAHEQKIGELHIGRGSLFWFGRNRVKSKRIRWTRFAEMMDELAYGK